ncbi:MAG: hypothetical protein ACI8XV_001042 [Arenicella sp.]
MATLFRFLKHSSQARASHFLTFHPLLGFTLPKPCVWYNLAI